MTWNAAQQLPSIKDEIDEIKRRRILNEAARQFFDNGYEATSLDSIADALGVTKQFIYSRFRGKAELLASICHVGASSAEMTVSFSASIDGDPASKLAQVIQYFVRLQIEHRREAALFFREAKSLPPEEAQAIEACKLRFHRMLCGILNEGKEAGLFDFDDASLAASALGGMASWTFTWFQPEGRWDPDSVARQIASLALKTMGLRDPSPCLPVTPGRGQNAG
ncbi:TetR family transcriptional regulator [Paracoccus sp. YIM 132242]|uniref:TetR family transcriptional regulator n=1 Tax=Paracoccus lichenicola TaxID=2665644 RepID=A0A6L6HM96_9RHOB|nr:TetR family transcriptional regulator [Paracoccus lichenicola]MTE00296.1 TetR family transcriptional regulator [Paracoccus lichenicola]